MNEPSKPNGITRPDARPKLRLFDLMALLFLVFVLAAVIVPGPHRSPRARLVAAETQIANFGTALEAFKVDNGYFPPGPNGLIYLMQPPPGATNWHGPYMERSVASDPWGHSYRYECPGRHHPQGFDLSATGPDGKPIGNWKQD